LLEQHSEKLALTVCMMTIFDVVVLAP